LTIVSCFDTKNATNLAHRRAHSGCDLDSGASADARARFRKPLPGGPGAPVGRQKDRSVRSVLNARQLFGVQAKHRAAASRGNPGLGLSHRGDSRWRVPWRSAGRRARLSNRAALPRKRQLARQCAFRRFASLLCLGGFSGVVVMSKTRTCESVARAIIYFVIASVSEAIQGGWRGAGLLRRWRSSQ
jgi:hypothetical protein